MTPEIRSLVDAFLGDAANIPWLSSAGQPSSRYLVVPDIATGWDDWNASMLKTWLPQSKALEASAQAVLGNAAIDLVFELVADRLAGPIERGLAAYFDQRPDDLNENTETNADLGLWREVLAFVQRDLAGC